MQQVPNRFTDTRYVQEDPEGIDDPLLYDQATEYIDCHPKSILNKVPSKDVPLNWSINPYQGCEHGCIYCYARESHNYWGYGAGLDFERKILVKRDAAMLLRKTFMKRTWKGEPIMLSGNTDPYQPVERRLNITKELLVTMLEFRNPVGIITKNALVLRDIDLLQELSSLGIVKVNISLTTLNEDLRRRMEPRTATGRQRLKVIEGLSKKGIPVNVLCAPLVPGLNAEELPTLMKEAAAHGARSAGYIVVRANGEVQDIFKDWLRSHYPDRYNKVVNQIKSNHGGSMQDRRQGVRMRGEGEFANAVRQMHQICLERFFKDRKMPPFAAGTFRRPGTQMELF